MLALALVVCSGCSGGTNVPSPTNPSATATTASPTGPAAAGPSSGPSTSVGTSGTSAVIRIGLVAATGSDAFSKAVTTSLTAAAKSAEVDLVTCDPAGDPTLELDCARRLSTQQVDGWILLGQAGNPGEALCASGPTTAPLVTIGSAVGCQRTAVTTDDQRAGLLVGAALAGRSSASCAATSIVLVTNGPTDPISTSRVNGIRAGLSSACPEALSSAVVLDAGTQDRAYDSFTAALTAIPVDTDVLVAAVNDGAALGVLAALPTTRTGQVFLAAIGGDRIARCQILADPRWIGDAALFPERYGPIALSAVLGAVRGGPSQATVYIPAAFLTSGTMSTYYDTADCTATG